MATEKHPYTSGSSHIAQIIAQLRKAFPGVVNAETLKKFEIAPNNETYILNILKFGDQATYDAIFKSIRENLLNGNGA